jgi:hypothetical protein
MSMTEEEDEDADEEKDTLWVNNFGFFETKFVKLLEMRSFFLSILFWELANNKIWETKFAKLLEMLEVLHIQ